MVTQRKGLRECGDGKESEREEGGRYQAGKGRRKRGGDVRGKKEKEGRR